MEGSARIARARRLTPDDVLKKRIGTGWINHYGPSNEPSRNHPTLGGRLKNNDFPCPAFS
ncbi:hypothetical protein Pla52o_29290 [Novipirellula galeiformis]|uniref:Uncharacterized protein n=1 Tax=Novipirellula galeiformis TaxID=2528004 RepID=A0A5C6CES6_9BACT|nr:hypothetical protein Pla52o_29290 [Novipirellula galeiformis]